MSVVAEPYGWLKADSAVLAVFGSPEPRVYPDEAPQDSAVPYAVFRTITGQPQNYLADRPDIDRFRVQFDVYGATRADAGAGAQAIRAALEIYGHQVSQNPEGRDLETRLYLMSFDFSFWQPRG